MIIFDLDGTLADCEHRRHLLHPEDYPDLCTYSNYYFDKEGQPVIERSSWRYKSNGQPFDHGWDAFFNACGQDSPIWPTIEIFNLLYKYDYPIQIWSGRSESVRDITTSWLQKFLIPSEHFYKNNLKMRPINDSTPDDRLKEQWYDLHNVNNPNLSIEYVFDDRPKVVRMWRRRGIFVFDCNQTGKEF